MPATANRAGQARSSTGTRRLLRALALTASLLFVSEPATAQAPLVDGVLTLGGGFEGADPGFGVVEWQRARTRIIIGAEWSSSEHAREAFGAYIMAELERTGSFGGELRYRRWLSPNFGGFVGPVFVLQPESLFGLQGGLTYVLPLGEAIGVFAEGSFAAFPMGSDRAHSGSVIMWASLALGTRLHF